MSECIICGKQFKGIKTKKYCSQKCQAAKYYKGVKNPDHGCPKVICQKCKSIIQLTYDPTRSDKWLFDACPHCGKRYCDGREK